MRKYVVCFFLFFLIFRIDGQKKYPQNFAAPLKIPLILAGTFAEPRSDHFHTGLDIKTQGRTGLEVHAIEAGYISRVKISPVGYGKAIYIKHPNGYTSVYAHLSRLEDPIADYVRKQQYARKSFAVDLYLKKDLFQVTRDQIIALSGNSGSSGGPHLHFEIRESTSEIPINPLLFGYKIMDTRKPTIKGVYIFPIDGMVVNKRQSPYKIPFKKAKTSYYSPVPVWGKIGVEVKTYDQTNGANNKNGIYSIDLYVNDQHSYNFTAEKVSFDQVRYVNSHIDYAEKQRGKYNINKCFVDPGNKLKMYKKLINRGIINVEPNKKYRVRLVVKDFSGNRSTRSFILEGREHKISKLNVRDSTVKHFDYKVAHHYKATGIQLYFPAYSFYKNIDFRYKKVKSIYRLASQTIPLQKGFTISIKPVSIAPQDLNKTVLVRDGKSIGGAYKNGWITDKSSKFGDFSLKVDRTPPKIISANLKNKSTFDSQSSIIFTVVDNLSGINKYVGKIDGKWILLDYDKKNNRLRFDFENEHISNGSHTFELSLTDKKNNTTYIKKTFLKK